MIYDLCMSSKVLKTWTNYAGKDGHAHTENRKECMKVCNICSTAWSHAESAMMVRTDHAKLSPQSVRTQRGSAVNNTHFCVSMKIIS